MVQSPLNMHEVLLACRWRVFGGHSNEERLQKAFGSFHAWCVANKKKSSLNQFELKTFKMQSCPDSKNLEKCNLLSSEYFRCVPRLQNWPGGCGKAFDTTLLCRWLLAVVEGDLEHGHVALSKIPSPALAKILKFQV